MEREDESVPQKIDDVFQAQILEFIQDSRNQYQLLQEQITELTEEMKSVKTVHEEIVKETQKGKRKDEETEILSQGFSSYKFTPFQKDKQGNNDRSDNLSDDDDENEKKTRNKKVDTSLGEGSGFESQIGHHRKTKLLVNDEDDSDESDEDDEKPDKNMSKKDGRKSFMREANESGNLSKGFQQVIVQPPNFTLMLKGVSKDPDSVKFIKHFIGKFNYHHKSTPMGHQSPKISRNITDPVLQVLLNWYMANKQYFDRYLPELQTDTLEEFGESDNDCMIKIITNFIRPTTAEDQMLLFKSIDPVWGSLDPNNLKMETYIEQYNVITRYISDLESMYRFIFDFDLRKDVKAKTRKVFAEIMKKSMPHFERDHSKASFWKIVTAKIPGPLRRMIFEEAKKEAEGKVKITNMKVFSDGDLAISVMDIAKRMLVEALKLFNGEISSFNKNYQVDKLSDPTAKLTNIQGDQHSGHSFLDEDIHQETSDLKDDQPQMDDSMNNIAPSTPTGQGGGNKWQGGASKQMPTSRSSHPTRDLFRTDKDISKTGVCFKYAKNGAGPNGCDRGESCYYSHDPQLCKEFLRQTVNEQHSKKDKLMALSQCLGSPQLVEIVKELGDEFEVFHSLLKNVE